MVPRFRPARRGFCFAAPRSLAYSPAMFRRLEKLSLGRRLREFFWPHAGWRRSSEYLYHRLARLPGSPYSIAAGFACGAAVSFTPFVGLHFILGAVWAWAIRANVVAGLIGTAIGNPWTFPFIWFWLNKLGLAMLGAASPAGQKVDFAGLFGAILNASLRLDVGYLMETAWPVLWPMFIAGIPTAMVVWVAVYLPLKWSVEKHQVRRRQRRTRNKMRESSHD